MALARTAPYPSQPVCNALHLQETSHVPLHTVLGIRKTSTFELLAGQYAKHLNHEAVRLHRWDRIEVHLGVRWVSDGGQMEVGWVAQVSGGIVLKYTPSPTSAPSIRSQVAMRAVPKMYWEVP